jgi:hypothetical protein
MSRKTNRVFPIPNTEYPTPILYCTVVLDMVYCTIVLVMAYCTIVLVMVYYTVVLDMVYCTIVLVMAYYTVVLDMVYCTIVLVIVMLAARCMDMGLGAPGAPEFAAPVCFIVMSVDPVPMDLISFPSAIAKSSS